MNAKHTPGPWAVSKTAGHAIHEQSAVYSETTGRDVAIVYDGAADASLLAAAPELLAACRYVMGRWYSHDGQVCDITPIREAIAKAKGNQ